MAIAVEAQLSVKAVNVFRLRGKFLLALALCIPVFGSSSPVIAKSQSKVTGIFTTLTSDRETGDISGTEIFVMYSNRGYYVTYQCAAGEVSEPVLLKATIAGSVIQFRVPESFKYFCDYGDFRGIIKSNGIEGVFQQTNQKVFLRRKESFSQRDLQRSEGAGTEAAQTAPLAQERREYGAAFTLLKQGKYTRAYQAFRAFLEKHPGSPLVRNAQYWSEAISRFIEAMEQEQRNP